MHPGWRQRSSAASARDDAAPETTAAPVAVVEEPAAAAVSEPAPAPAPPLTEAPTTTSPPPPRHLAPPADPAPAPAPPAPASPTTPGGVEALIREIWPDDLEERALTIARRESGLRPDAYNGWCCYGVFQIYFNANRSFLARYGVTSADQLLDARTNVHDRLRDVQGVRLESVVADRSRRMSGDVI